MANVDMTMAQNAGISSMGGAKIEVIDEFLGMGDKEAFATRLIRWADAALITSTAIINNTMEGILDRLPPRVKAAILGPSTPLLPEAFERWPSVKALAGTVPRDIDALLRAVRHGLGTPHLHRHSCKATITLQEIS